LLEELLVTNGTTSPVLAGFFLDATSGVLAGVGVLLLVPWFIVLLLEVF